MVELMAHDTPTFIDGICRRMIFPRGEQLKHIPTLSLGTDITIMYGDPQDGLKLLSLLIEREPESARHREKFDLLTEAIASGNFDSIRKHIEHKWMKTTDW